MNNLRNSNKENLHIKRVFPIKFFSNSLKWLNTFTNCKDTEVASVLKVLDKISSVYNTRGKATCIKYVKDLRHRFLVYLLDEPESTKGDHPFLPNILKSFKSIKSGEVFNYPLTRLILTCLYSSRFIRLKPQPSHDSIIKSPGHNIQDFDYLRNDIVEFLKRLGINRHQLGIPVKSLIFKDFHMTSKSGPNGHALWTSFRDLICMPDDLKQSIKIVGGHRLYQLMDKFYNLYLQIPLFFESLAPRKGSLTVRRLTVIPDKEGKSREVAILDYWSQAALKPLHSKIFSLLLSIHQDCTHNQSKLIGKLIPLPGSSFHSIDLTTATDRFPIDVERLILEVWFGKDYADAWKSIMVNHPFEFQGLYYKYNTGNPMGAYSSWATFALAHHFTVYLACKRAGYNWKRCPYMLLGDDIVIANDFVANKYKEILLEWDIPYSPEKTHVSKLGYEFAKQIHFQGKNISPFPVAALYERRKSPIESVMIIFQEFNTKEWCSDVTSCLKDYLIILQGWNRPRMREFFPKIKLVIALLRHLQSNSDLGTPIKEYVAETTGKKVMWAKPTSMMYAQFLAGTVLTTLFQKAVSRVTDNTNKLPLGELATRMVMSITSLRSGGEDCFDLIESVPFLGVYGRAEETYLRIRKPTLGARLIKDGRQMREQLGKVDIPLSDTDFYTRHRDVIVIQCLRVSKEIDVLIKDHLNRNKNYLRNPIGVLTPKSEL